MTEPKIGPTFFDEVRAAKVSVDGWSVDTQTGEFHFNDDVPQDVRDKLAKLVKAHDPTKQVEKG